MTARVLVVGLGDVGERVAAELRAALPGGELVLASRPRPRHQALAAVIDSLGAARARFCPLDAADPSAVARLVARERPDVVVNCACLLSPWALLDRADRPAAALRGAGLAVQLAAQLPLARSVAQGVADAGGPAVVVNCSYPDVVNPVLAAEGLAPAVGAGNAQMIHMRVRGALGSRGDGRHARVVAHHAHVVGCMTGTPAPGVEPPLVFVGDAAEPAHALAYAGEPVPQDRSWNTMTAAGVAELVRALTGGGDALVSVPGPMGLPGGYPVRVTSDGVVLDLPGGVTLDQARAWNADAARADGVADIAADGTVSLTEDAAAAASALDPRLAEPLAPGREWERWTVLREALSV